MARKSILKQGEKMYRYSEADRQVVAAARKKNKDKRAEKRLYALELRAAGKSAEEVSAATGSHRAYITRLTAKYRAGRIGAISGNHSGGNRRNMSVEEDASLQEPYREKAETGQIVEVSEIKFSYEQAVGHRTGGSQIYYVLRRHGWRKAMPRSKQPKKAGEEVIETSKKSKKK